MRRTDPFFQGQRPHKNGYLESLHRTYGEPVSALPSRGDVLFERALKFRQDEKARYAEIERQAHSAKEHAALIDSRYEALQAETQQIKALFEQLSKHHDSNGVRTSSDPDPGVGGPSSGSRSSGPVEQRKRDDQHANGGAGGSGGDGVVPLPDVSKDTGEAVGGDVPDAVLPAGGDVRGQAEEHTPKGSEPGGGSAASVDVARSSGGSSSD